MILAELLPAHAHVDGCPRRPERVEATEHPAVGKTAVRCHDCGAQEVCDGPLAAILSSHAVTSWPEHELAGENIGRQRERVSARLSRRDAVACPDNDVASLELAAAIKRETVRSAKDDGLPTDRLVASRERTCRRLTQARRRERRSSASTRVVRRSGSSGRPRGRRTASRSSGGGSGDDGSGPGDVGEPGKAGHSPSSEGGAR